MTMLVPLELCLRLLQCACAVREVSPHLGVAIEGEQRVKIFRLKVTEHEPMCCDDDHLLPFSSQVGAVEPMPLKRYGALLQGEWSE